MKKLLYLFVLLSSFPASGQFFEEHEITCDSTLLVPGLGYPTWAAPEIVQPPAHGEASLLLDSSLSYTLIYKPQAGFNSTDTVVVECAHATQITCDTGIYIIHVNCLNAVGEGEEKAGLRIFPNPFDGNLTVEMDAQKVKLLTIRLLDLRGGIVFSKKVETEVGSLRASLDLAGKNLPGGNYLVEILGEGGLRLAQVISHIGKN